MNESKPISPRQRLQELLAIPERERTDAQWDEMNELEIQLASGNRQDAPDQGQGARRNSQVNNAAHPRPGGGPPRGKKQFRKPHRKQRPGGGDAQ